VTANERPVRQAPSALCRDLGDEVLVAVPGRPDVDVLTGGAALVWRLLETPLLVGEMVAELAEPGGPDPLEVRAGLDAVLADLRGRGLIEEVAA
jgi:hypothetical protein